MPHLRDVAVWNDNTLNLREAWGRLDQDEEAITDEESVFFLHETLVDRLETTRRCLPLALQCGPEVDEGQLQAITAALTEDLRLMNLLEHQRVVEFWEVAALSRERLDLESVAWVSVVLKGSLAAGRYSVMTILRGERKAWQGRTKGGFQAESLIDEIRAALLASGSAPLTQVLLSVAADLPELAWTNVLPGTEVVRVPSWETAFRVLREGQLGDLRGG
jgi:hypothetical protein